MISATHRYSKESVIANRRISDIEMVVQRVQEENTILRKELTSSQNKSNNLQKTLERTSSTYNKLVNEASNYKDSASKLENEVLICKEETSQYMSQVDIFENESTNLKQDFDKAQRRIFDLEAMYEMIAKENDQLKNDVQNQTKILEDEMRAYNNENKNLRVQVDEYKIRAKKLQVRNLICLCLSSLFLTLNLA